MSREPARCERMHGACGGNAGHLASLLWGGRSELTRLAHRGAGQRRIAIAACARGMPQQADAAGRERDAGALTWQRALRPFRSPISQGLLVNRRRPRHLRARSLRCALSVARARGLLRGSRSALTLRRTLVTTAA
jgi:hypothetical protein